MPRPFDFSKIIFNSFKQLYFLLGKIVVSTLLSFPALLLHYRIRRYSNSLIESINLRAVASVPGIAVAVAGSIHDAPDETAIDCEPQSTKARR